jgi:hypothetical protein
MPVSWKASNGSSQLYASVAFFRHIPCNYTYELELLRLRTLQVRRHRLDALFVIHAFVGSDFCPSLIDNISLRVLVMLETLPCFL